MKYILKNNLKIIIAIILTFIFSTVVTVYASGILASDISFTPTDKNWHVTNIEEALNSLYNKKSNAKSIMGYPTVSDLSSDSNGYMSVFSVDQQNGYGPLGYNGWFTGPKQQNSWIAYNYTEKVNITYARLAYGIADNTTWIKEGEFIIQASNDGFKSEVVDLATVKLTFDQELLKKNLYGIYWEGNIENEESYYSYRVFCSGTNGWTGVNKAQLTYVRFR